MIFAADDVVFSALPGNPNPASTIVVTPRALFQVLLTTPADNISSARSRALASFILFGQSDFAEFEIFATDPNLSLTIEGFDAEFTVPVGIAMTMRLQLALTAETRAFFGGEPGSSLTEVSAEAALFWPQRVPAGDPERAFIIPDGYTVDSAQSEILDNVWVGSKPGPAEGICGDVITDGVLDQADIDAVRQRLADPLFVDLDLSLCSLKDDGPLITCDVVDAALLVREVAGLGTELLDACNEIGEGIL